MRKEKSILTMCLLFSFVLILSACSQGDYDGRSFLRAFGDGDDMEIAEMLYSYAPLDRHESLAGSMANSTFSADKVIHRASIGIIAEDFASEVEQVQELTANFGGFIESSHISGEERSSSGRFGEFTIRIPIASFNEMLERLEGLGTLSFLNTTAVNVSDQYADITSRLNSLRTQEGRILELIEIAEDLSDLLLLEERLGEIIYNIERLTGERNYLDNQIAYSTITIMISEHVDVLRSYDLASESLGNIFISSLRALLMFGLMSLRVLVALIPWLIFGGIVWLIIRMIRPKKSKRNKGVKAGKKVIEKPINEENND